MPGVDYARRRDASIVQERLADTFPVDGIIRGLAHQLVVPGRLFEVQAMWPDVGIAAQGNLKPRLLQQRNSIRWGHLDPVDLASAQGGQARRGFWHGEQHDLVDFGNAVFVPILLVRFVLSALAWHEAGHLEWASARGIGGKGTPVLADFVPLRRAAVEDVDELEEHKA